VGEVTNIAWCHHTFNPWIGCTRVSPGCVNCYAEKLAASRMGVAWGPGAERRVTSASYWKQLQRWDRKAAKENERRRVFVASLADVFDEEAPEGQRTRLYVEINKCPHLDFLLLTKRPQNWLTMLPSKWLFEWPANVRLGFTAEDQTRLVERLVHTRSLRMAYDHIPMMFVSYEPALGPLDLILSCAFMDVDQVIAGGESGTHARPAHPEWFQDVRDECVSAGCAFFFKQWGEWLPASEMKHPLSYRSDLVNIRAHGLVYYDGKAELIDGPDEPDPEMGLTAWDLDGNDGAACVYRVGKELAGHQLDGEVWQQYPEDTGLLERVARTKPEPSWEPICSAEALRCSRYSKRMLPSPRRRDAHD
jgi:protein gp37